MARHSFVIAMGAIVGLLAGILAPLVFIAACVWDGRTEWSVLSKPEVITFFAVLALLGTLNGGIGAWDGRRSGECRMWPVAWATLLLFLYPLALWVAYPSDSKTWGPAFLMVGIVAPFVWVAGRVGQEIGKLRTQSAKPA